MVPNMVKIRQLLESINGLAKHLTDEEISDIGEVLLRAIDRLEKDNQTI